LPADSATCLSANLLALSKRWGWIPDLSAASGGTVSFADDVVAIRASDGRWLPVHDSDPKAEANRWIDTRWPADRPPALACVIGAGLGYVIEELAGRERSLRILVLEPEPALAAAMLARRDWTPLVAAGRLMVLVGPGYQGQHDAGRLLPPGDVTPWVLPHPIICGARPDAARTAARIIRVASESAAGNEDARQRFAPTYVLNTSRNVPMLARESDVARLFGRCRESAVVVAAAGPSLNRNIEELRPYRDEVTLVAVDTAMRPLLAAGLAPDIVVAVDPSALNARHLTDLPPCASTALVAEASLRPEALESFAGRIFACRVGRHDPWPWLQSVGLDCGLVRAWGSVTTTAFDLALKLDGDPIVFIGADLAYTDGRPYCRGITFDADWNALGRPLDDVLSEIVRTSGTIELDDVNGEPVRTSETLKAFADWLIAEIALSRRSIWNATGAGILAIANRSPLADIFAGTAGRRAAAPQWPFAGDVAQSAARKVDRLDARLLVPSPVVSVAVTDPETPTGPSAYARLTSDERVQRTRMLAAQKRSDVERWSDPRNLYCRSAMVRASAAAQFIPDDCRVLDLGAGGEAMRNCLGPGCTYVPADLVARGASTVVVDLNRGEFPSGCYDVVVALAVLEYVYDVEALLRRAAGTASLALITYCAQPNRDSDGERFGWFNRFTFVDLLDVIHRAGWHVARADVTLEEPAFTQWFLALRPAAPPLLQRSA
jgi:hypothetical protein